MDADDDPLPGTDEAATRLGALVAFAQSALGELSKRVVGLGGFRNALPDAEKVRVPEAAALAFLNNLLDTWSPIDSRTDGVLEEIAAIFQLGDMDAIPAASQHFAEVLDAAMSWHYRASSADLIGVSAEFHARLRERSEALLAFFVALPETIVDAARAMLKQLEAEGSAVGRLRITREEGMVFQPTVSAVPPPGPSNDGGTQPRSGGRSRKPRAAVRPSRKSSPEPSQGRRTRRNSADQDDLSLGRCARCRNEFVREKVLWHGRAVEILKDALCPDCRPKTLGTQADLYQLLTKPDAIRLTLGWSLLADGQFQERDD